MLVDAVLIARPRIWPQGGLLVELIDAFEALDGYRDSEEQIEICSKEIKYNHAIYLYNEGYYDRAIKHLKELDGYKDSEAQIKNCYIGKYGEENYEYVKFVESINVGDTYIFGSYEQNNDTTDGKEEIEWIVLAKDGMSLLLISKYALYNRSYSDQYKIEGQTLSWGNSPLREWLNKYFFTDAFSPDEQSLIQSTKTGSLTKSTDKVFLLDGDEAYKYFATDEARKCVPTDYAIARGARTYDFDHDGTATCGWWLLSYNSSNFNAEYVDCDGKVTRQVVNVDGGCPVRPALWINLEPQEP